jgi:hypothetical protein
MGGGYASYKGSAGTSVDYIVYVGNVAYDAARGTGACCSGLNVGEPIASDADPGTAFHCR